MQEPIVLTIGQNHTKVQKGNTKMAYVGLNDQEKLSLTERFVSDLTKEDAMAICIYCGRKDLWCAVTKLNDDKCLDCGKTNAQLDALSVWDWVEKWQLLVSPTWKPNYASYDAVIETPFDAWLDTNHNTITVMLSRGYRTFPVPCKSTWAFDIEFYIKNMLEGKPRRRRRKINTAA